MLWRRGCFVGSLKYYVEKDIRETVYNNKEFKRLRWSFLQRVVGWGAQHLIASNVFILLAVLLVGWISFASYDVLNALDSNIVKIEKVIANFFVVQATLMGIIFPLVIAFIGILLQGKSANEPLWELYRFRSGFMLLGFSSLFFLLYCSLEAFINHLLPDAFLFGMKVSITFWFCFNLLFSIWFLWATIDFLSTKRRADVVARYGLNEVLLQEIRSRLPVLRWLQIEKMDFFPKGVSDWFEIVPRGQIDGGYTVATRFNSSQQVTNVWFGLVKLSMLFWLIDLFLWGRGERAAVLKLDLHIDGYVHSELILAATALRKINPITSFLLRRSVWTVEPDDSEEMQFKDFLRVVFDPIEDALVSGNATSFEKARSDLLVFYRSIEKAMSFEADDNTKDNWLFLSQGTIFSHSLLTDFVMAIEDVTKKVVNRLNSDSSYYDAWCYTFIHLMRDQYERPSAVVSEFISGHYRVWSTFISWANSSGDVPGGDFLQHRAIKYFIGSWEAWSFLKQEAGLALNETSFDSIVDHLERTSFMVVAAMKFRNDYAAKWAVDTLIYWHDVFLEDRLGYESYRWHRDLLTASICKEKGRLFKAILNDGQFDNKEGANVALENYWVDIRCLTAAYLMDSNMYPKITSYREYIAALIGGQRLEPTADLSIVHRAINSPADLLSVYLRQVIGYESSGWHRTILGRHLDRLSMIEEPERVSGRIHTSSGSIFDRYMLNFFKVIGVGLSNYEFSLSGNWSEFLNSGALSQREREQLIRDIEKIKVIDESVERLVCRQFDLRTEQVRENINHYVASIERIIQDIKENIEAEIVNADVDVSILKGFGVAASSETFSPATGPLPMSLFKVVRQVENIEDDQLVRCNVTGYPKSAVSVGIDASRAVNEKEWLHDLVKQQVVMSLYQDLLAKIEWQEYSFTDDVELLQKAVIEGGKIIEKGHCPILFIGPWNLIHMLDASLWDYAEEKDKLPFEIKKETGRENSYICHLEGIEVFRHSFSKSAFSLLMSKESFEEIKVSQFADQQYVDVEFIPDVNGVEGCLTLSFGLETSIVNFDSFKFVSLTSDS